MVDLNRYKFFIGKQLFARQFRRVVPRLRCPILDVGSGSGPFRRHMPAGRILSMDIDMRLRPAIVANARQMPFETGAFQSVICTEVLEHVPQPDQCLQEIRRVLAPGGILYLTVPMLWPLHYEPHDYYRYTRHGIRYLLETAGFELMETNPIGGLFSFLCMRVGEKGFNLVHKLAFFLPKPCRHFWSVPLTLPIFFALYLLSFLFDPLMKKDVFAWAVLARSGRTG